MAQEAMRRWGFADEAPLTLALLTSCCAALFLTGRGLLSVRSPGVGDPWYRVLNPKSQKVLGWSLMCRVQRGINTCGQD